MNIGQAVESLKQGKRVARAGWNGKGMWLQLRSPPDCCRVAPAPRRSMSFAQPDPLGSYVGHFERVEYVEMKTADGKLIPWLCSQTDLLAEDWECVG